MTREFVKIDLHIHTPKSDCHKYKKDAEDEYLKILRQAKEKGIKIIAITDHNSIEGYKEYILIKERLISRVHELKSSDLTTRERDLKKVEKDLLLFEEIVVLPGIEFEVKNNIHMLLIFDETTQVERMERLLFDGGYHEFGEENPVDISKWDVLDLYENSKNYDCIVLDAHTDSNKGIWTNTKPGSYRAQCFRHPQLYGVGYNSESQRDNIEKIVNTAKEYKRDTSLSFVKFSDAHSLVEVGSKFTWLRRNDIYDLSYLKSAFRNPSEYLSVEEPSLAKILDNIIRLPNTFGIPDIQDDTKEYFKKLICGLSNSEGGYILFGLSSEKKKRGIDGGAKGKENVTTEIDKCIECLERLPILKKTIYPFIADKAIFSVKVSPSKDIIGIKGDGNIYSIRDNKLEHLSTKEAQNLVETKFLNTIETKIGKRIQEVEKDCSLIKAYFAVYPIINKFESQSYPANFIPDYDYSVELAEDGIGKLKRSPSNGFSKGNIFFLQDIIEPRLDNTYLRYSLPMFTIQNLGIPSRKEPVIYVVPGGGVFYSNRDYPFFSDKEFPVIKLKGEFKPLSRIFVTCFLKSSFQMLYCKNKFDNEDIFASDVFKEIRLPIINQKIPKVRENVLNIERKFNVIIELEKNCLRKTHSLNTEQWIGEVTNHNLEVDKIAYEIDLLIYELLNLSTVEVDIIEGYLRLNDVYIPSHSNNE